MRQVFILNALEQAALAQGHAQILRLADGAEFEFRFDVTARGNGTRPRRAPSDESTAALVLQRQRQQKAVQNALYRAKRAATRPPKAKIACPTCHALQAPGTGLHTHLRIAHGLSVAARHKLAPVAKTARIRARRGPHAPRV